MAELKGLSLSQHLHSIFSEIKSQNSIYGFPLKLAFRGIPEKDLSVFFHNQKAATPLGPAAGPHTQMAQNILLSFLGGCRIMELKTVQILDQLEIPRPCIYAPNICFNVEWSQELRLQESLHEYLVAWMLLKFLEYEEVLSIPAGDPFYQTIFDISVGYNLEGISSEPIHQWIQTLLNASEEIARLKEGIPASFSHLKNLEIPGRVSSSITLSTFHGCPANEIEAIVNHLIKEHKVDVMVKMNPTLMGFERVSYLLHDKLGFHHIQLDPHAFEADLQFQDAVTMMKRLRDFATAHGKEVGCKFTNTLVVRNTEKVLPGEEMYLSGPPLHVIAMDAMHSLRQEMGAHFPISFSGGIDKTNVADALSCNMKPVTICTDLLKQRGYQRLRHYFQTIRKAMDQMGASCLKEFIIKRAGGGDSVQECGLKNSKDYVNSLLDNPYYHYSSHKKPPKRVDSKLQLFDCILCNLCIFVCPNGANFSMDTKGYSKPMINYIYRRGRLEAENGGTFVLKKDRQIGTLADFCNECGNCDTYCPEEGAPYIEKPRFFFSKESFERFSSYDGFCFFSPHQLAGRMKGKVYSIEYEPDSKNLRFSSPEIEIQMGENQKVQSFEIKNGLLEGSKIDMEPFYVLDALYSAALENENKYPFVILRGIGS